MKKKNIVIIWLVFLSLGVAGLFWYNDWVYSLPTPVPSQYKLVKLGESIHVARKAEFTSAKPTFYHFFNPDCPCSKFNIPHFKSLVKQFGHEVNFVIVPLSARATSVEEIQEKFGLDIPVLLDPGIAVACGVYSTPQAAIVDVSEKLFYRGNYNKSRYCADKKTEYAKIALESLLSKNFPVKFDPIALKAYGCRLPLCTK